MKNINSILQRILNKKVFSLLWILVPLSAYIYNCETASSLSVDIFNGTFWKTLMIYLRTSDFYVIDLHSYSGWIIPLISVLGSVAIYSALSYLHLDVRNTGLITLISIIEIYRNSIVNPLNIIVIALIIWALVLIRNKRNFSGSILLVLASFTNATAIFSLMFVVFSRRRFSFILGLIAGYFFLCGVNLLSQYDVSLFSQYLDWVKNDNFGKIYFLQELENFRILADIICLIILLLPYMRIGQYQNKNFRVLIISSLFIFMGVVGENLLIAIVGMGLWVVTTSSSFMKKWHKLLLVVLTLCCSLIPSLQLALPILLIMIWLNVNVELLVSDFTIPPIPNHDILFENTIDLILPCYNPGKGWDDMLINRYNDFKKEMPVYTFRFILVNDGSKKGIDTPTICRLKKEIPNLIFVDNKKNQGKGAALRDGLQIATSKKILYTDYDFPYKTKSMCKVVKHLEMGYDIVIATRNESYYNKLSFRRRVISYSTRILNFMLLGMTHTDTQGGLKGFNNKGRKYLETTTIDKFLFDTEFIYRASQDDNINIENVSADLRDDVHFSDIGNNTIVGELGNLLKIAIKG